MPRRRVRPGTPAVLAHSALFLFGWAGSATAQVSEPSSLRALEIDAGIRVDGRLDDEAWSRAERISNFTQRELDFGSPVSERTEVAVLFDSEALYIGFWGYDREPGRLVANEMERDFQWSRDDNFEVVLDTFDDNRTGFLFVTNPNGAVADALVAGNGSQTNRDWDGVWEVAARITDEGWFAEMRIPFSTLRYGSSPESGWGINFERNIRRKREQALWQGWSRDFDLERVSQAGTLLGIRGPESGQLVDVRPHGIAGIEWVDGRERQTVGDAGLDILYNPSPAWRLSATFNPDFAQVESDREEVNLSRFSLFFPEQREFFLEGQDFFDFELGSDTQPFYSRRIGLSADRTEIPILAGGRALGKKGGTTLGAMVLQTAEHEGTPGTNFGAFRWRQDVLEESSVGVLLVTRLESGRTNLTYGVDLEYASSEVFGDKEMRAGLVLAQTYTSDAEESSGFAHRLYFEYPNDLVEFSASWVRADDAFNPEVGFTRRTSYQRFETELALSPRPDFLPFVQQLEFKPWEISYYVDDLTGELQSFEWEFVPVSVTTRGGEELDFSYSRRGEHLDRPFELFDGAEIPAGTYWYSRWSIELDTFSGRRFSGSIEYGGGGFFAGTQRSLELTGRYKMNRHLTLQADYEHNLIELSGAEFPVDEFGLRANFAFTPRLFGSITGQWNSEDDEAILNFRLNWIPEPGSDLFLVINQQADTLGSRWDPVQTTVLSKLVWRLTF